jgi:tRNA(Glu) U13 pseudouridine synthase TruD
VFITVDDLEIIEEGIDFVKIKFTLPKGCYATVVIDALFA